MKRTENKKKLNLGCGKSIKKGWVNLDINEEEGIDVVHDLNILPLPFDIETFECILCENVLEHINYLPLMNDLHRILKKGGVLIIRVPHFTSKSNYADPSHIHFFSTPDRLRSILFKACINDTRKELISMGGVFLSAK